jgi:uncharacterized RDD family membrane protein YckC
MTGPLPLRRLDTLYSVETPEGIALTLRSAGVVSRAIAYLIDFGIRIVLMIIAAVVSALLGGLGAAFFLIFYFLLEWFYPVAFELSRAGATPGKRVMGLQVVMDSGLPVTPAASMIRNLLRSADFMPSFYALGAATMLLRADSKRLGDMAAGTLVVYSDSVMLHGEVPEAPPVEPARSLSTLEQVAIVSWAARASRLTPGRFDELASLAEPVLPRAAEARPAAARSQALLGVAHWVLGRRAGKSS